MKLISRPKHGNLPGRIMANRALIIFRPICKGKGRDHIGLIIYIYMKTKHKHYYYYSQKAISQRNANVKKRVSRPRFARDFPLGRRRC